MIMIWFFGKFFDQLVHLLVSQLGMETDELLQCRCVVI